MEVAPALQRLVIRRGRPDDARVMAGGVRAGFEGYRAWAGPGWEPPDIASDDEVARLRERLRSPGSWAWLAFDGEELAGHAFFEVARELEGSRREIPGLVHLAHLFVLPRWWGTGLAPALLRAAMEEMHARGFTRARLWTPAGQRRARAFYAREGWRATGVEWFDDGLQLLLVELQVPLDG